MNAAKSIIKDRVKWEVGLQVGHFSRNGDLNRIGKVVKLTATQVVAVCGGVEERYYRDGSVVRSHRTGYLDIPSTPSLESFNARKQHEADRTQAYEDQRKRKAAILAPLTELGAAADISDTSGSAYQLSLYVPKDKIGVVVAAIADILKLIQ